MGFGSRKKNKEKFPKLKRKFEIKEAKVNNTVKNERTSREI